MRITEPINVVFWRRVINTGVDTCWKWTGSKNDKGYGQIRNNKKIFYAHRISYEIHNGSINDGQVVIHSCDNPECTNPRHLKVGSQADNLHDAFMKGRMNGTPIFDNDVRDIINLYNIQGYTQKHIAKLYGCNQSNICRIVNNKTRKAAQNAHL
jgi:hypothetical protein